MSESTTISVHFCLWLGEKPASVTYRAELYPSLYRQGRIRGAESWKMDYDRAQEMFYEEDKAFCDDEQALIKELKQSDIRKKPVR